MRVVPIPWTRVTFVNTVLPLLRRVARKTFRFHHRCIIVLEFVSIGGKKASLRLQPLPPFSPSSPEFLIHPRRMVGEEIEKLVARSKGGRSFLIVDFTGWMMKRRDEYPRRGDTTVSFFPSCNQKIRCYLSEVIASLKIYHRICVTATFCADDVIKGRGERRAQEEGVEM